VSIFVSKLFRGGLLLRVMALDYGEKRIGIALSDPLGITAQGMKVLERTSLKKDIAFLADTCREEEVAEIVLGLPRNLNGSLGPKAREVEKFGEALQQRLDLPVLYYDEWLSTVAAEKVLLEADLSRKKRKKVIDKTAAVIILQSYLDSKRPD